MILCYDSLKKISHDYDIPLDIIRQVVFYSPDLETVYFKLEEILKCKELL